MRIDKYSKPLELMISVQARKIHIISTMYGESWNMDCPFLKQTEIQIGIPPGWKQWT